MRRELTETVRNYGLYESPASLGRAKRGKPHLNYANYIANSINDQVPLTAKAIIKATEYRAAWWKSVLACTNAIT